MADALFSRIAGRDAVVVFHRITVRIAVQLTVALVEGDALEHLVVMTPAPMARLMGVWAFAWHLCLNTEGHDEQEPLHTYRSS